MDLVIINQPQVYPYHKFYQTMKRLLDIGICIVFLPFLLPLFFICWVAIRLDSPGPAIFTQNRVGSRWLKARSTVRWENTSFTLYKFRTMYEQQDQSIHRAFMRAFIKNDRNAMAALQGTDTDTKKMVGDPRVTRVGRLLRRTSLDELPQLWNVLKGEMTLVGPRPPIQYEVDEYQPWHRQRLQTKPGLTGLWQVTKRSAADFDEIARLDIWYIQHQTLWLDLKILMKTIYVVCLGRGAF